MGLIGADPRRHFGWRQAGLAALLACVSGCADLPSDLGAGSLYRGVVGGDVEPAPGQDAAWPNLATVPPRPSRSATEDRQRIQNALIADRANARHEGGPTPPVVPAPAPELRLPDGAVVPDTPPSPPALPGVPQVTAPPRPPPAPPPAPASLDIDFSRGSSTLSTTALVALRRFADARGTSRVSVVGAGDATSAGGDALGLGLARAEAVATALREAGVPPEAIQIAAEPAGRGAVARLIQ